MRGDIEWGKYFSKKEFQCSTTGDCKMEQDFIDKMNQLRVDCNDSEYHSVGDGDE